MSHPSLLEEWLNRILQAVALATETMIRACARIGGGHAIIYFHPQIGLHDMKKKEDWNESSKRSPCPV